jgi:hypothetical protein
MCDKEKQSEQAKGKQANFCTSEVRKYTKVQRRTQTYRQVRSSFFPLDIYS